MQKSMTRIFETTLAQEFYYLKAGSKPFCLFGLKRLKGCISLQTFCSIKPHPSYSIIIPNNVPQGRGAFLYGG